MADEGHLLKSAIELAQAINETVDEHLPHKLAGIVKTHSALAVGSAFVPIPGADMAAAVANIWTMYVRINREIHLPFGENFVRSVAAGVATNIGSAAVFMVAGSALKLIPVVGTFGGAVIMGTTIYGVTMAAGTVYFRAITKLLKSKQVGAFTEADLKAATDEVMKDKDAMKNIIKEGKAAYKNRQGNEAKLLSCPKCQRQYPLTELFCAADGTQLAAQ